MNLRGCSVLVGIVLAMQTGAQGVEESARPLEYSIKLDTVITHDDGKFLWFHPRVAAVPAQDAASVPTVVMTIQKHLHKSDFYSGLSVLRTNDLGATWSGPTAIPELDWRHDGDEVIALCDVTPGWHAPTGKIIAIGAKVRYRDGVQLYDKRDSRASGYAAWDPKTDTWTPWTIIDLSDKDEMFYFTCPGCTQWIVEDDGTILLPIYCKGPGDGPTSVTVLRCAFDGTTLSYIEHGDVLSQNEKRGVGEPQITKSRERYYLSIRHDDRGYVTVSDDGLHYAPMKPWTFDDGQELGSYNTQQHWVTLKKTSSFSFPRQAHSGVLRAQSDGLLLTYTRRGANNDHIMRHRAPIFIAQVDPATLQVIRATEKVLIPERGATMGNFGAATINENESWVTVSEGIWNDDARKRGAKGAIFVAHIIWNTPNLLADQAK